MAELEAKGHRFRNPLGHVKSSSTPGRNGASGRWSASGECSPSWCGTRTADTLAGCVTVVQKPLYYLLDGIGSSSPRKSSRFSTCAGVSRDLDLTALSDYFRCCTCRRPRRSSGPSGSFRRAHQLIVSRDRRSRSRRTGICPSIRVTACPESRIVEDLLGLLEEATRLRDDQRSAARARSCRAASTRRRWSR